MSSDEGKHRLSGRETGKAGRERCRLIFPLLEADGTLRGVHDGDDGADTCEAEAARTATREHPRSGNVIQFMQFAARSLFSRIISTDDLARVQSHFPPQRYTSTTSPRQITPSPLLSTLGSATNTAAQNTRDWAKSLPYFSSASGQPPPAVAGSPPNYPIPSSRTSGDAFVTTSTHAGTSPPPVSVRPRSIPNQQTHSFGGRAPPPLS